MSHGMGSLLLAAVVRSSVLTSGVDIPNTKAGGLWCDFICFQTSLSSDYPHAPKRVRRRYGYSHQHYCLCPNFYRSGIFLFDSPRLYAQSYSKAWSRNPKYVAYLKTINGVVRNTFARDVMI